MKEFSVQGADSDVLMAPACADKCDVALFAYDSSDASSFEYIAALQASMFAAPGPQVLFVATKSDLSSIDQVLASPPQAC